MVTDSQRGNFADQWTSKPSLSTAQRNTLFLPPYPSIPKQKREKYTPNTFAWSERVCLVLHLILFDFVMFQLLK
jgi:hypothetical protein